MYNRCAYPLKYSEKYGNWERLLEITCAVFRKHYIEKNGVTINVGLDRNCTDRSYLYGRLTAVADKMESDTFEGDARQTNAKRYMSAMLNAPFKTWAYLEERVLPYTAKIIKQTPQFYARYEKELGEINSMRDTRRNSVRFIRCSRWRISPPTNGLTRSFLWAFIARNRIFIKKQRRKRRNNHGCFIE